MNGDQTPTEPTAPEVLRLTPTEDLILDLLVARRRLGYSIVQIPTTHTKALGHLTSLGLIGYDNGNVEKHHKVWLTEAGMVYAMDPNAVPPALAPTCQSWYFGPKTDERRVDCRRRNHHKGDHKAHWWARKKSKKKENPAATVRLAQVDVTWTDAEAGGLASAIYGDQMRALEADAAARTAAAKARFGK